MEQRLGPVHINLSGGLSLPMLSTGAVVITNTLHFHIESSLKIKKSASNHLEICS